MAHEEQLPGDQPNEEVPTGPESGDSGPQPQDGDLTVEDILSTEQSGDAAEVDPLSDTENPYLDDLRRLTAEYANYRKRTEANVELDKQRAKATVVTSLLTVLDDLDRAEVHGDLVEGSTSATL